jgi:tetratricopeptide (TPR) repeat protein
MRRGSQLWIFAGLSALVLGVVGLGASGYVLRGRVMRAVTATTRVQAAVQGHDLRAACADLQIAAADWQSAHTVSRPLAPLLRRLGWLPMFGSDLRVAPDAIALAQHGATAGATVCRVLEPALVATSAPERLAVTAQQLSRHANELTTIQADLQQAQHAWTVIEPNVATSPRLAAYQSALQTFGRSASTAIQALEQAQQIAPELPWLLGLDDSRRYLVVLQNPFELRPTGGFIGLVCVVRVDHAVPALDQCRPSEAYTTPAANGAPMPFPYTRYLRLGNWYLRDANWSPDFPTTAQTLQQFWAQNQQAAVDGVIAVDPYALVPLLHVTGPLRLGDGSQIDAEHILDAILSRYYDGAIYRDKGGLAELLPALFKHLLTTDPAKLPQLAAALHTSIAERHLLAALNQPKLAAALQNQGWDGSIQPATSDTLRIVDADVGYGGVNAFIERLTHYDVALDQQGTPLTATLTLTYTNRYSPWAEAPTAYAVNGQCTDPRTLKLEQRSGCYANYLRVYVPQGSRLIEARGLEETLGVDQQHNRTIFGGYLRVNPGVERVVQISYRLPALTPGSLMIEKQPGTIAPPYAITAHTPQHSTTSWVSGRTDLMLTLRQTTTGVAIDGPSDADAASSFAHHAAWINGLAQWQAGNRAAALQTWQRGAALDRALDHGRALSLTEPEAALALTTTVATVAQDGRAAFEQATIEQAQGRTTAALYQQAAEHSPGNPLAQLVWARQQVAAGTTTPAMQQIAPTSSAIRRWRASAAALEQTGRLADAATYLDVLLRVTPTDRALALHHADLLLRTEQTQTALARYETMAATDDIWGRLAGARRAQINGDPQTAIAMYTQALPLATSYPIAFGIGDGLRDLGAMAEAVRAYDLAANLAPDSIWPLLAAGDMLRGTAATAARQWYTRAQQVDPASGYPDFALGTMLLNHGEHAAALEAFTAAVAKQPDIQLFSETLEHVQAQQRTGAAAPPHVP